VDSRGTIEISCDVKNVGKVAGDEVIQLYVHDREAAITRPVQELAGFCRVRLKPGEAQTVSFSLKISQLAFYNVDMSSCGAGNIDVMVGSSSEDIRSEAILDHRKRPRSGWSPPVHLRGTLPSAGLNHRRRIQMLVRRSPS